MNDNTDSSSISSDSARVQLAQSLQELASLDDEDAVDRIREIARLADMLAIDWHQLLVEEPTFSMVVGEEEEHEHEHEHDPLPINGPQPIAASGEDRTLLRNLLNRVGAGSMVREDLQAIKRDMEEDEFTRMDQRYLTALARRLKVST